MSLTFILGSSTTFNENIKAEYYEPLKEYDFENAIRNADFNESILSLKNAYLNRVDRNKRNVSGDSNTKYFSDVSKVVFGKDGTSDAYVKRGLDHDLVEYFERQETEKRSWRFETTNSLINFKNGGKVIIGSKEYIIIKVINQINTADIPNLLNTRPNMELLENWGVKTLILA